MYTINIIPRVLHFKQPAGTSRGSYTTRNVWYIHLSSIECPGRVGVGECAPLPKLSCDDLPDYEQVLRSACQRLEQTGELDIESLRGYPSILFGLETALRHYETQSWALWDTPFSRGEAGIPINGLIWMGSFDRMLQQIEVKMQAGYRCIKLKIGAINFEEELALLRHIRAHYSAREIELRVDANGAFSPADAMDKLNRLAELDLHSIEHPPPVYHTETISAWRDQWWQRMDCRSGKATYRLVDHICAGVEYRSECHSPMVCDFPESVATRIRYRATVYGQCRDVPRDSKRLFMVLQIRGVGT